MEMKPWPSFMRERIKKWEKLKTIYKIELAQKESEKITVRLSNGEVMSALSWRTTPYDLARLSSRGKPVDAVVAMVNDQLWDLNRPLESNCKMTLIKRNDPIANQIFQHTSVHLLGGAMERIYGGLLCDYSYQESEFCYDMYIPDRRINSTDFQEIGNVVNTVIKDKHRIQRLVLKKNDILDLFEYNTFKKQIINEKITTPTATVYRFGPFIDLCEGPHMPDTGKLKAIKITNESVSYWKGDSTSKPLQRLCGFSFLKFKKLLEWKKQQEENAKRDHLIIGREQELFFFHEMSPGSPFFLPRGTHIYNKLIDFIKAEYRKRGYKEVITPHLYKAKLWETSGHWDHCLSDMFTFDVEKDKFVLKPMNCPGHCLMFGFRNRSWRELPIRIADFGVLHRKEHSEELSGLKTLYRFQQDDAHIFCTVDQIKSEILGTLDFLKHIYGVLGFNFELYLSTRPEKFMGEAVFWDFAEKQLAESLDEFGEPWKERTGGGAFYGPKIDIIIKDFLQRSHQCATIQLDFQLPIRFNLFYKNKKREMSRPVIIHRAILGSIERMIAVLAESYAGKWPFWLSPNQAIVLPLTPAYNKLARQVKQQLFDAGIACKADTNRDLKVSIKLRHARWNQYNFILIVGAREVNSGKVNVRNRDNVFIGEFTVPELLAKFQHLTETKCSKDEF